jgi:hypothetical protein
VVGKRDKLSKGWSRILLLHLPVVMQRQIDDELKVYEKFLFDKFPRNRSEEQKRVSQRLRQVQAEKMHPLLAVDNQAFTAEDECDNAPRPKARSKGQFICFGLVCNVLRHKLGQHRRGMVKSKEALCDFCRSNKLSVTMAYDIEQTLQYLPGVIQEIVEARTDNRMKVVQAIARQLECVTTQWTKKARNYVTAQNRAARRISKTLLLRGKGVLVGADGDLSEAERSSLDIQSVTVCDGKCELNNDEGENDEDGVDGEENRLCRTCGHLLPMIDLPTMEAACRAAPTGLCPCCGLEDGAQTSMARPCGVCRSWWLLWNHKTYQRHCKEAVAAPIEDFGEGSHTDLADDVLATPNLEATGHQTQDHTRSPEAHCEVPSPGTPEVLREQRSAVANARAVRRLLPELQQATRSRQQESQQRQVHPQARSPSGREVREGADCRANTDNTEGPSYFTRAEHTPNNRNYSRLGQPTGAHGGVAQLPTQETPLLTRQDLEMFGRDWDHKETNQDTKAAEYLTKTRRMTAEGSNQLLGIGHHVALLEPLLSNLITKYQQCRCRARHMSHDFGAPS